THRPPIDAESFGTAPRDWLLAHDFIPGDLLPAWQSIAAQALDAVRHSYDRAGAVNTLRLHGDCHAGNVLWTDDGPHFVDFDDAPEPGFRRPPECVKHGGSRVWALDPSESVKHSRTPGSILATGGRVLARTIRCYCNTPSTRCSVRSVRAARSGSCVTTTRLV